MSENVKQNVAIKVLGREEVAGKEFTAIEGGFGKGKKSNVG